MNKLSVLLAASTSLSTLLAVPSQAQADSVLMEIIKINSLLNRRMDCYRVSNGENCGSIDEDKDEINQALESIRQGKSESGSSFTNGGSRQNQNSPSLQSESNVFHSSFCDGYLKGSAITGNYSSVPDACRQYMRQPSSSQRSNLRDSDRYVDQQELRNRQIQRNADINLDSNRDSNCLASSEGCVRIRFEN
jgi:hypothetical protein